VTTTATIDRHRHLLRRLGPRGLEELSGPVSDREAALIVDFLEQHSADGPLSTLVLESLAADGSVRDWDAFAVLADPARRDAYLEQASR
jgi:hypothetical protein